MLSFAGGVVNAASNLASSVMARGGPFVLLHQPRSADRFRKRLELFASLQLRLHPMRDSGIWEEPSDRDDAAD
jgi:hypothetical protein